MALEVSPYNVNRHDRSDETPLAIALRHNNLIAIDMLRRYDAEISAKWGNITQKQKRREYKNYNLTFKIMEEIGCDPCKKEIKDRQNILIGSVNNETVAHTFYRLITYLPGL